MKKLALGYAGAGSFEMPKMTIVGLEKEANVAFATPTTVYQGAGSSFSRKDLLRAATEAEVNLFKDAASSGRTA